MPNRKSADKPPGRKALQAQKTRHHIVKVARDLFARHGYADTSIEDLIARIGLTRGALYHHFRDKRDLFRAVWEQGVREGYARVIAAASRGTDLWDQLRRGREAYLDFWTNPLYRILLIDGPSVLDADERRRIQAAMGPGFGEGALLKQSLTVLKTAGEIGPVPMDALATVLGGAFDAAALAIATAHDKKKARREIGAALNLLIDGLHQLAEAAKGRSPD